jgi:predicted aldo/keto reductase-like oxidoreductase
MKYRKFGKLAWEVSALGFGAMRLPLSGETPADVDEPEAIRMIRYAIDNGVNYLDTAYPYHAGQSERIVGRALKDGYREKVKLATKLLARIVQTASDFDRILEEQQERLQTNINFYLLHGLNRNNWPKVRDLGVLGWAEKAIANGRFDRLGFSFHDSNEVFTEIVDSYDNWALSQIQYNFMDVDYQAGRKGLRYAASKGLAVVVMEPLRGGGLTQKPPEQVVRIWDSAAHKRSLAEWGLLWVWNQPEVSVALSGMTTMGQVVENVEIAGRSGIDILTRDELALYEKVADAYRGVKPIPCTNCGYCMPCPHGVNIPLIFQLYNDAVMWNNFRVGRNRYNIYLKEEERADRCVKDEECLEKCPQEINIPKWLEKIHAELSSES